jgi:carbonic anhydrase
MLYIKIVVTRLSDISDSSQIPFISGSDFKGQVYYLKQFHFHWGYNIWQGSEHYINNEKFPAEVNQPSFVYFS